MRELKRGVAKANMREAGFEKLFKRGRIDAKELKARSIFARNWKRWVLPVRAEARQLKKIRRTG